MCLSGIAEAVKQKGVHLQKFRKSEKNPQRGCLKDKVRVIRESHLSDNNAEAYFELYARITGNKNQKTLTTILCNCKHGTYTLKAFDGLAEKQAEECKDFCSIYEAIQKRIPHRQKSNIEILNLSRLP